MLSSAAGLRDVLRRWIRRPALEALARTLAGGYALGVYAFFVTVPDEALKRAVLFNALTDDEQMRLRLVLAAAILVTSAYVAAFVLRERKRGGDEEEALAGASFDVFLFAPLGAWPLYEALMDPWPRILGATAMSALAGWAILRFATRSPRGALLGRIDGPAVGRLGAIGALVLGLAYGIYSAIYGARQYAILWSGWDLAIFSQIHWNITTSGVPWSTLYTDESYNHYSIHFSPILHLTSLLYRIHRSPGTLYVIEDIALGLAALPLWAIANRLTKQPGVAFLVTASYLLNPCAPGIAFHEFHEIAVFPLIAFAFMWAVEAERPRLMWLFFVLGLMVREDIGAYFAVFGAYLWLRGDRKRAVRLVALSAAYVVLANKVFMPALRNTSGYILDRRYDGLFRVTKTGLATVVDTVLANPTYVIQYVVTYPDKWRFFALVFLPVAFLPLASRRTAMLVVPGIAFNVLASFSGQYSYELHYTAHVLPFLYYGTVAVLVTVEDAQKRRVLATTMLVATCLLAGKFGRNMIVNAPLFKTELEIHGRIYGEKAELYRQLAASVPKEARVRATGNLLVSLAERRYAFIVPWGRDCDWAFIDYAKEARQSPSTTPVERRWVLEKLRSNEFGVVYGDERVVLMAKGKPTDKNTDLIARVETAQRDDPGTPPTP